MQEISAATHLDVKIVIGEFLGGEVKFQSALAGTLTIVSAMARGCPRRSIVRNKSLPAIGRHVSKGTSSPDPLDASISGVDEQLPDSGIAVRLAFVVALYATFPVSVVPA